MTYYLSAGKKLAESLSETIVKRAIVVMMMMKNTKIIKLKDHMR